MSDRKLKPFFKGNQHGAIQINAATILFVEVEVADFDEQKDQSKPGLDPACQRQSRI